MPFKNIWRHTLRLNRTILFLQVVNGLYDLGFMFALNAKKRHQFIPLFLSLFKMYLFYDPKGTFKYFKS